MKNIALSPFNQRILLGILLLVLIWVTLSTYRRWQPEQQVLLHQAAFFKGFEEGDWEEIDSLLAPDFQTFRSDGRDFILREGREYRRHFFYLTITPAEERVEFTTPDHDEATLQTTLTVTGNGTAIAQAILYKINSHTRSPFVFRWKKQSWKPWDWQLTSIEHPLLKSTY